MAPVSTCGQNGLIIRFRNYRGGFFFVEITIAPMWETVYELSPTGQNVKDILTLDTADN